MGNFIKVLGYALIPLIVTIVIRSMSGEKPKEKGRVRFSKLFLVVGGIVFLFIFTFFIISTFLGEPWMSVVFFAFLLLPVSLLMLYFNFSIDYDRDGFYHRNFWGVRRYYHYKDITSGRRGVNAYYLRIGKRKLTVEILAVGSHDFYQYAERRYKSIKGKKLPSIPTSKHDIFNGKILDGGQIIGGYIFCQVVVLALFGFVIWLFLVYDCSPDNMLMTQESMVDFVSVDGDAVLTSSDGTNYKITIDPEFYDTETVKNACDGRLLTLYYREVNDEEDGRWLRVVAIREGEDYLLGFEAKRAHNLRDMRVLILFMGGFELIFVLCFVGSVIVGRNPVKYRKFVWLFFKPCHIAPQEEEQ